MNPEHRTQPSRDYDDDFDMPQDLPEIIDPQSERPFRPRRAEGLGASPETQQIFDTIARIETQEMQTVPVATQASQAETLQIRQMEGEVARLRAQEYRGYLSLRRRWSNYLSWLLFLTIWFQIILTILVGINLLDFTNYTTFLHIVIGENFIQIIGLIYIVVKFLFPKGE